VVKEVNVVFSKVFIDVLLCAECNKVPVVSMGSYTCALCRIF